MHFPGLPPYTTIPALQQRFAVLLFDAYGVLVDSERALPGAAELIASLNSGGKPYFILTNASQISSKASAARYQRLGLDIDVAKVISSADLIGPWARAQGLEKARFYALGPASFHKLLEESGIDHVVEMDADAFEVVVIGNQDGFPFIPTLDHVLTCMIKAQVQGRKIPLLLPNPDLIYPMPQGYGFTAGIVAEMLLAGLRLRFPGQSFSFEGLGKPFAPIFAEAKRRAGTSNLVLIGDQLATDVKGARDAGIASVLIGTGLSKLPELRPGGLLPDFLLEKLGHH